MKGAVALLLLLTPGPDGENVSRETAADRLTLRDGKILLGQIVEQSPRGGYRVLTRRALAVTTLPEWSRRWQSAEAPAVDRALKQRKERLRAWRRDRASLPPQGDDRILSWIDAELAHLEGEVPDWPLMLVHLDRGDVKSISRAPKASARLLRLALASGLNDPEERTPEDLRARLEGRGFDPTSDEPVPLDSLLPPSEETPARWLVRRAATEVTFDRGLKFAQFNAVVVPDPDGEQAIAPDAALAGVALLKDLLGDRPTDPLRPRLAEVAARGRVGALVSRLDVDPELSWVSVELSLWVHQGGDQWVKAGSRSARVRPDDLGPDAGKDLAADPTVAQAFKLIETLGLGAVPPELKRRSLNVGAATRKALGQARSAAQADLATLALPVSERPPSNR
jgi:hypothetical protein